MDNTRLKKEICIRSVSLPVDLAQWARKNGVSLSKTLQMALINEQNVQNGELFSSLQYTQQRAVENADKFRKAVDYMREKGVLNEFLEKDD